MAARREVTGAPAAGLAREELAIGQRYFLQCEFADDGTMAYLESFTHNPGQPGGGPSVDAIARQVYHSLPLVFPEPHTAPPVDAPQLVGLPIWLWVDDTVWRDFQASATLAGVTVTVVAHPRAVAWDMGDGHTVTCDAGTAWQPSGPADQQTGCSHLYQFVSDGEPGGRYDADVTVTWSVSWSASTGESGTLPDVARSTTFTLDVGERQAVIEHGSRAHLPSGRRT